MQNILYINIIYEEIDFFLSSSMDNSIEADEGRGRLWLKSSYAAANIFAASVPVVK